MTHYVTSARLRAIIRDVDGYRGPANHIARKVASRARLELARRERCRHCEVCGFDGDECGCRDNGSAVLVNEYEPGEVARC